MAYIVRHEGWGRTNAAIDARLEIVLCEHSVGADGNIRPNQPKSVVIYRLFVAFSAADMI